MPEKPEVKQSSHLLVAAAMAEFQQYLVDSYGEPISLETVMHFAIMVTKVTEALPEE